MFDNNSIEWLGHYVYALLHPGNNSPFYMGKVLEIGFLITRSMH